MWRPDRTPGLWFTPAVFGVLLILIGVLIWVSPRLLEFFVASVFILAGGWLLSVAWRMRQRTTIRRIDVEWHDEEGPPT